MRVFIEGIKQAKRELAKTYSDYKSNKLSSEKAKTRVYILRAIIEADFKYEIEQRIIELEKKVNNEF